MKALFINLFFLILISLNVNGETMQENLKSEKLHSTQQHIFEYWETLSETQKEALLRQVHFLDLETLALQQKILSESVEKSGDPLEAFSDYAKAGNQENYQLGKKLISEGLVGCLIVAGGQGTRLKFEGPKGLYPVSIIKQKTLFQVFAEKIVAAGQQAGRPLPVAIMTSSLNHPITVGFFEEHDYFGLDRAQVSFFQQTDLPFLDQKGDLFLEEPFKIAMGPDGNGSSLEGFLKSGIWQKWSDQGVKYLNFVLIDNPLADPFDAELVGFHDQQKDDVTIKCVARRNAEESVGLVVRKGNKVEVVEYSEIPQEERRALDLHGDLKHNCANLSLFCFNMSFIKEIADLQMPLHKAWKASKYLSSEGVTKTSPKPNAWKYEKFIFDVLPWAEKVSVLLYPREHCFAPLKNFEGNDSITTVRAALQKMDRLTFENLTGVCPPERPFELAQDFYYPTPDLILKWRGKNLPEEDYILP